MKKIEMDERLVQRPPRICKRNFQKSARDVWPVKLLIRHKEIRFKILYVWLTVHLLLSMIP